ncbi:hypothetical protein TNCV_1462821 [Trichonephila clavipes]|uniref:Uncharacterized protein n=1 Tax=Trichonephila clavipes TaxID=2585209 RepID=A0A8X6SJQ5_TRICX|nr:hypothetical protein TNCV_1462821 [Trichonephila clavipes]
MCSVLYRPSILTDKTRSFKFRPRSVKELKVPMIVLRVGRLGNDRLKFHGSLKREKGIVSQRGRSFSSTRELCEEIEKCSDCLSKRNSCELSPLASFVWRLLGKILGKPTPLVTKRKKRQARTRWRKAKPTMAASEYREIRWMRNENICKQYRN